jgi:hypothetical protein
MRLTIHRSLITYAILLFYLCTPMLDGMVCADCVGNAPFQGEITISQMKASHVDVSYSQKGEIQSSTTSERGNKSFCSICANVLMGTEDFSSNLHIIVDQCDSPHALPAISELHYSIDKPPQNLLV